MTLMWGCLDSLMLGVLESDVGGSSKFGLRRATQNNQTQVNPSADQQVAEQELQVAARPRGMFNFIRPRPKTKRILKKQLGKKVTGIGSSTLDALDLD
ncbi:hypothetical protein Tco_0389099 [Tanacetum coccineum]